MLTHSTIANEPHLEMCYTFWQIINCVINKKLTRYLEHTKLEMKITWNLLSISRNNTNVNIYVWTINKTQFLIDKYPDKYKKRCCHEWHVCPLVSLYESYTHVHMFIPFPVFVKFPIRQNPGNNNKKSWMLISCF